jgi:putative FmdB family regulatory protein
MPIYAYRCAACGHAKDVLQKIADAPLSVCPACGQPRFEKQLTAAGFQLKGSGWYVTDFRDGGMGKADKKPDAKEAPKEPAADAKGGAKGDGGADAASGSAPAPAPAAAPAPTPAAAPPPSPAGSSSS